MPNSSDTREQWLLKAYQEVKKLFKRHDINLPNVYISVGWPSGGMRSNTYAETFAKIHSSDKKNAIYITPRVNDPIKALTYIVHEACHVSDDCRSGHGQEYKRVANLVGLIPPWTDAVASDALKADLRAIADKLGKYPHSKFKEAAASSEPPAKTYLKKVVCPVDGYTIRITQKWITQGLPLCGICASIMRVES